MTEKFIKIVKRGYDNWYELEKMKKNLNLMNDNKNEFNIDNSLINSNLLEDYLKTHRLFMLYLGITNNLKEDEFQIYCYLKSEKTTPRKRTIKRISNYTDFYWNLQIPGLSFGPSDFFPFGKNREKFKQENKDKIIYPPEGKSFEDENTFFKVQAEFIEETLRTNQEQAKKLILQKYRKR